MPVSGSLIQRAMRCSWRLSNSTVPSVDPPSTTIHSKDAPRCCATDLSVCERWAAALSVEVTIEIIGQIIALTSYFTLNEGAIQACPDAVAPGAAHLARAAACLAFRASFLGPRAGAAIFGSLRCAAAG